MYFSGEMSLEIPRIVTSTFLLPLPMPEDPVSAGMGRRFRKILWMIVTCTILYSNRNQDRSFKNKLEKFAFRVSCRGVKT